MSSLLDFQRCRQAKRTSRRSPLHCCANSDTVFRACRLQLGGLTRTLAKRGLRFASSNAIDSVPYYDVVIAGGSVMGLSTAYHLAVAAPKLKIAVVEKDPCVRC